MIRTVAHEKDDDVPLKTPKELEKALKLITKEIKEQLAITLATEMAIKKLRGEGTHIDEEIIKTVQFKHPKCLVVAPDATNYDIELSELDDDPNNFILSVCPNMPSLSECMDNPSQRKLIKDAIVQTLDTEDGKGHWEVLRVRFREFPEGWALNALVIVVRKA